MVHVAAAAIVGADGNLLISRRHDHLHQGGLWEFPGGKVEPGESAPQALCRELQEELGITPTRYAPLITIPYHYPDKHVLLDVWRVDAFEGVPVGREGQPLRWVAVDALRNADFPAANRPIIAALKLPARCVITGEFSSPADLLAKVVTAIGRGAGMVQLRIPGAAPAQLSAAAALLYPYCRRAKVPLIVNGDPCQLAPDRADGIHLNRHRLQAMARRADDGWREPWQGKWIGASCHDAAELAAAQRLGLDYVSLSPVLPTASHPGAAVLGWPNYAALVKDAALPVYALGGVGAGQLADVRAAGGQGIAAIGAFWG